MMMRTRKTLWFLSFLLLLVFSGWKVAVAQVPMWDNSRREANKDKLNVFIDHTRFRSTETGKIRLEIYYQVFNRGLEFKEANGAFEARYSVKITVMKKNGDPVDSREKSKVLRVRDRKSAASSYGFRTSQINFDLDPGKYKVEFSMRDLSSHLSTNRTFKVKLSSFDKSSPTMSDVEFVLAADQSEDKTSSFFKGNVRMVPSVSRSFGGDEDSRLLYYLEVYGGTGETEKVVVETRLRHESKGMIYRDTLHTDLSEGVARQLRQISLVDFPPGSYEMEVYLRGWRNKKLAKQDTWFEVLWDQDALIKFEWKQVISQLSYISKRGELDGFKSISTLEEKKKAFNEFWRERDVTEETVENEVKNEFYRRVHYSNRRFSVMKREGWKTDRGRIYIVFGEPDEVDDFPYSIDAPPYQIWQYFTKGRYRKFTFIDEDYDGDYRLRYPYDGLYQSPDF